MSRTTRALALLLVLAVLNTAFVGAGAWLSETVVPSWKKGPLIDPAAPYSPENAVVLTSVGLCIVLDTYVAALVLARRLLKQRWWQPLVAMGLALVVGEAAARTWLHFEQITYFRPHPTLHWEVRPNLEHFENVSGGGRISTNDDGMRNVTVPREKAPDEFRILILGDSSNFGHGVDEHEVWSWQLEEILADKVPGKRVEVLNGACPGWTTYQAVEFMKLRGLAYHPDLVIAGFNNDPGPDYLGDEARRVGGAVGALNGLLWKSESYLLAREVVLSTARRFFPAPDEHYTARKAGEQPSYGKLSTDESQGLVPRVSKEQFLHNIETLFRGGAEGGYQFAWINMPINRAEPELYARYVNMDYRTSLAEMAKADGFPIFDVDARWLRTREPELHIVGHVHHPSAKGHRRLAEQVAHELVADGLLPGATGDIPIDGWPPSPTEETLRLGISTFTPVHAHVAAVLAAMPELAAKHGLVVEPHGYLSGGPQGDDVARGALDAFFTCEVPAVQMVGSRTDVRIVASPGTLGRVAVLARAGEMTSVEGLRGRKVGLAPGSTTDLDWQAWGQGLGSQVVPLKTDQLVAALDAREVDAIVAWDPWVEDVLQSHAGKIVVLTERPFRSDLAVSIPWSTYEPGRARRLVDLVREALTVAAADRPRWDAEVAKLSGWSLPVVKAVADRNEILAGKADATAVRMDMTRMDQEILARALAFVRIPDLTYASLVDPGLLDGRVALRRYSPTAEFNPGSEPTGVGPGKGPVPGKGPPPGKGGPPGKGPPPAGKGPPPPNGATPQPF